MEKVRLHKTAGVRNNYYSVGPYEKHFALLEQRNSFLSRRHFLAVNREKMVISSLLNYITIGIIEVTSQRLIGYKISNNQIKPNPNVVVLWHKIFGNKKFVKKTCDMETTTFLYSMSL